MVKTYREKPVVPFPSSGKLSPEDDRVRKLERENRELRKENEIFCHCLALEDKLKQIIRIFGNIITLIHDEESLIINPK